VCLADAGYNFSASDYVNSSRRTLAYHRLVEAIKFAYARRSNLADEDYADVNQVSDISLSFMHRRLIYDDLVLDVPRHHHFTTLHRTVQLVTNLTSSDYAATIRRLINDSSTHRLDKYGASWDFRNKHGTAHVSVVAADGSAVSLTSSINM
jgi:gamma-glutamyltranspeptidase/glutathione hydrolase/leukotriene-C4 hydrolase